MPLSRTEYSVHELPSGDAARAVHRYRPDSLSPPHAGIARTRFLFQSVVVAWTNGEGGNELLSAMVRGNYLRSGPIVSMPDRQLIELLAGHAAGWIVRQQERYRGAGIPLTERQRSVLHEYFPEAVLNASVIVGVNEIENPDFYPLLAPAGLSIPLIDFSSADGITFADTILIRNRVRTSRDELSLLFHELVHSVQYRILGVAEFASLYVAGWLWSGGDYAQNPLEAQAYALQARFGGGAPSFSVETEVRQQLGR